MDVLDKGGATVQIGAAFVNDLCGKGEGFFANNDKGNVAAGGGEFRPRQGREQWIGRIANADSQRAVLFRKRTEAGGVRGWHGRS